LRGLSTVSQDELPSEMVECRSHVVESVAKHDRECGRQGWRILKPIWDAIALARSRRDGDLKTLEGSLGGRGDLVQMAFGSVELVCDTPQGRRDILLGKPSTVHDARAYERGSPLWRLSPSSAVTSSDLRPSRGLGKGTTRRRKSGKPCPEHNRSVIVQRG